MVALSRVAEPIYRAYLGVSQRAGIGPRGQLLNCARWASIS